MIEEMYELRKTGIKRLPRLQAALLFKLLPLPDLMSEYAP